MTTTELNIMIGIIGILVSISIIAAIWRHFNITKSAAEIQEELANFYTPDILQKNKKNDEKDEGKTNAAEREAASEESDGEGSDKVSEDDGSESEGFRQ